MIHARDLLKDFDLSVSEYHISEIKNSTNKVIGYQSTVIEGERIPVSGGFATTLKEANKIAMAEFIERKTVRKLATDNKSAEEWCLDNLRTACGFAVGFDESNTVLRSLCEGVERYALSQWIDEQKPIKKVSPSLSEVGNYLSNQFQSVDFYQTQIPLFFKRNILTVYIGATIAKTENGAFLGSNAQITRDNLWDHALVESFRHLLLSLNPMIGSGFPYNRVQYFSQNKSKALASVPRGPVTKLKNPVLKFHKIERLHEKPDVFIARTIFNGWTNWSTGAVTRFLY